MSLIWVIAKREFTENIVSLRLLIGLIVCLALFVTSTYVLMEDYEKRLSVHNAAEIEYRDALEDVKVYSHLRVDVVKPPEPFKRYLLRDGEATRKHIKGLLRRCPDRGENTRRWQPTSERFFRC